MRTLIDLVVSFVVLNHTCNIGLTIAEHSSITYIGELQNPLVNIKKP